MPIKIGEIKLYSVDEISKSLNVTRVTIRRYMKEGRIGGQKVAGRWYVSEENLGKYFSPTKEVK